MKTSVPRRCSLALLLVAAISAEACGQTQWSQSERDRWADQFEAASEQIEPRAFASRNGAKRLFLRRVDETDAFLKTATSPANYENWMKFLALDPLVDDLKEAGGMKDSRLARQVGREAVNLRYRLIGLTPGLELPVLVELREATERLIDAIRFRDPEGASILLAKQLTLFADEVREMDDEIDANDVAKITETMGLLISTNQAESLVGQLRGQFGGPNVRVLVSEQVVQSLVNRGVNQSSPVRDCILGTRIVGNATLTGAVTANVLPSDGSARIEVALTGTLSSQNTGYNGPVKLQTVGSGQVYATRAVYVSEAGVVAQPVQTQASLNTRIVSIDHRLRLVRNIARRRAAEQKPKADVIANAKVRSQVGDQFAEETDQAAAVQVPDLFANVRPWLSRLSLREPSRSISSTDNAIIAQATVARPDQLAASSVAPSVNSSYDLAIQLHESVIDNIATPVLAGRTLNETELTRLVQQLAPQAANSAVTSEEDENKDPPFEIDFARTRPLVLDARDGQIRLGIRGTRFSTGRREIRQAIEIAATYVPALMTDGSAVLVRQGEVEVDFLGRKRLTVSQSGLKSTIKSKFADAFPETLLHRRLEIPPTVKLEALAGQSFRPHTIQADRGWITVTILR